MKYKNLGEMFFQDKNSEKLAFKYKKSGKWIDVNYGEAIQYVERLVAAFNSIGLKKGDKVAIMSSNCVEWAFTDYAVVSLGAVLVPIYPTLTANQALYIINDSEAKVILVSDTEQSKKIDSVKRQLKFVEHFFLINYNHEKNWNSLESLFNKGAECLKSNHDFIKSSIKNIEPDTIATIIYTSGTTGEPKGAMLTHKNFLSNIESAAQIFTFFENDILLSFLPLSHILERMVGHYQAMYHSVPIAYAESIDQVAQNMIEIKPTLFISVPRLYEKIYAKVIETVEEGSLIKRRIFYWAEKTGKKCIHLKISKTPISFSLKVKKYFADRLVFKKLADKLGGKIRFMVSGGAPLSPEIGEFFGAAGLYILEGYGLTETSPAIAINRLEHFKYGTVGLPLPDVEVKIAEDGEILSRGNHIMKGYYKKEAETKEVIDNEGWFHTGDIGYLDDDGFLVITDRKKNIIVTAGGKNIAPQLIENNLLASKYIDQAVLIGDRKPFCIAIIVVSKEALDRWIQKRSNRINNYNQINNEISVRKLIQKEIDKYSINLASFETIKDFYLTDQAFTIENGLLTPTLKVKRKEVELKYKSEIENIYSN